MKKKIIQLFGIFALFAALVTSANATDIGTRASAYFRSTEVWAETGSNHEVTFWADVVCNRPMTKVGVSKIVIQQKISGQWEDILTEYGTVSNELLGANESSHTCSATYKGSSGQTYRAVYTLYAGDSNGSDTKERTTNAVVA